jgi:hypothetical protein
MGLSAGKLCSEGLNNFRTPTAFLDPTMVTIPYPTTTHNRQAHLIVESASPGHHGGSHSNQGDSTNARSVWRVRSVAVFPDRCPGTGQAKLEKWPVKLVNAAARSLAFYFVVLVPPPALEVTGDLFTYPPVGLLMDTYVR